MTTQRYSVTPYAIETILGWIKSKEIAIPEIQRPFVWDATKVRNLLDSLYRGYPIGYLITWRNPTVKLKDGTLSAGKRILIDGQQRITALMAALLGVDVLTEDYETRRIRIAFNPREERFEVANPAIQKDPACIYDIATLFSPDVKFFQLANTYAAANPDLDANALFESLEKLRIIIYNHVGVIELADDLDIETVTEIFIRVNSSGVPLSQADFAMSKIACTCAPVLAKHFVKSSSLPGRPPARRQILPRFERPAPKPIPSHWLRGCSAFAVQPDSSWAFPPIG